MRSKYQVGKLDALQAGRRILRKIISNDSRGFTVQADRWHGEPGWERQTHIDDLEADRLVLWGKTSYAQKTRRWEDSSQ
jgi:hypothetical protein